ncbi:ATP-grasp domain-containing protein [Candidatus Uhrbacteria bacterium]|nr:ATP-grasp domain-containing protein [Candidatus Uhrbacteria bacterium]
MPAFEEPIFVVHPHDLYLWGLEEVFPNACFLVDQPGCLSTIDLFEYADVTRRIPKNSAVLVMKPAPKLSKIAGDRGWRLCAPSVELNRRFENKLTINNEFLAVHLPTLPYLVSPLEKLSYAALRERFGPRLVVQKERGHAGSSTHGVGSLEVFENLKKEIASFPAKISPWLEGETWTLNGVVTRFGTLVSRPFLQLQNVAAYGTSNPFTTCGNAHVPIGDELALEIMGQAERFGAHLHREGYSGWFGLDVLVKDGTIVGWIECNPRLTASCGVFSAMQKEAGQTPFALLHVLETLGIPYTLDLVQEQRRLADGFMESHVVLRNEKSETMKCSSVPPRTPWSVLRGGEKTMVARAPGTEVPPGEPFAVVYKRGLFSPEELAGLPTC